MDVKEIKGLRKELGLSQEQLAREIGVSLRSVARWESGEGKPSQMALRALTGFAKKAKARSRRKGEAEEPRLAEARA